MEPALPRMEPALPRMEPALPRMAPIQPRIDENIETNHENLKMNHGHIRSKQKPIKNTKKTTKVKKDINNSSSDSDCPYLDDRSSEDEHGEECELLSSQLEAVNKRNQTRKRYSPEPTKFSFNSQSRDIDPKSMNTDLSSEVTDVLGSTLCTCKTSTHMCCACGEFVCTFCASGEMNEHRLKDPARCHPKKKVIETKTSDVENDYEQEEYVNPFDRLFANDPVLNPQRNKLDSKKSAAPVNPKKTNLSVSRIPIKSKNNIIPEKIIKHPSRIPFKTVPAARKTTNKKPVQEKDTITIRNTTNKKPVQEKDTINEILEKGLLEGRGNYQGGNLNKENTFPALVKERKNDV